ncbi:extracellular solute-binding protein [Cohnella yongneupensis]|uniref:Extracellular solute-binding protein n=1 Tax=Cohnella yongneupensis TaxID=425006 RepID=A0ABW0R5Z8_9BACL
MKKVTNVARRKIALVLILLGMMVLILSPWSDAPRHQASPPAVAIPQGEPITAAIQQVDLQEPASLSVVVAMDEASFKLLAEQNIAFRHKHSDITVTLTRIDPEDAHRYFERASSLEEAADVMLLKSEWVNEFAASGYLLPADAAFVGKALTEQFDALSSLVKWNGSLMWGVPLNIDPYVLVWNETLLREWLGDGVTLPLTPEQWGTVAARSTGSSSATGAAVDAPITDSDASQKTAGPISWLTIDPYDPYALLSWLENVSGQRTDAIWNDAGENWTTTPLGTALSLFDTNKAGVQFATTPDSAENQLLQGQTLVAELPYSEAARLLVEAESNSPAMKLKLDHSSWKLSYVWPRGTSYVISADTSVEEAAITWITEMTDAPIQIANEQKLGLLPVYRSIYDNDARLKNLLPARSGQTFPNQASLAVDPKLPVRMKQLENLWKSYASGQFSLDEWKLAWTESLADLQRHD